MIFLGIDPGTRRMGYGLIEKTGSQIKLIDAGIIHTTSKDDLGALLDIKNGIANLIQTFSPDILAIEKLFFAKNQKTAMAVAEARGVALVCALEHGVKIREYTPNEVKSSLTGYGSADKKAVLKMVKLILKTPELDIIDDASDALALAIVCSGEKFAI